MTFQKDGIKRRRHTRRELPEGQISQWDRCQIHFKREREDALLRASEAGNNFDPITGKEN